MTLRTQTPSLSPYRCQAGRIAVTYDVLVIVTYGFDRMVNAWAAGQWTPTTLRQSLFIRLKIATEAAGWGAQGL